MICSFTTNTLTLIFAPLLTFIFIVGTVVLLIPKSKNDKTFLLCKKVVFASVAVKNVTNFKQLKALNRQLKSAVLLSSYLVSDQFYEIERVFNKLNNCFIITSSLVTIKNNDFNQFSEIIEKDLAESIEILQYLGCIPLDLKIEDEKFKKAKQFFSTKYKVEQAKKILGKIKNQEEEL